MRLQTKDGRNPSNMMRRQLTRRLAAIGAVLFVVAVAGCQKTAKTETTDTVSKQDQDQINKLLADTAGGMNNTALPVPALPANLVFTRDDIPHEGGYLQVTLGKYKSRSFKTNFFKSNLELKYFNLNF